MKTQPLLRLLLFLAALIGSAAMHAQTNAADAFTIRGYVLDEVSNEPIPGASLRVLRLQRGTYADIKGRFRLPLPKGSHELIVSSLGYKDRRLTISGADDDLIVFLEPSSIELGTVHVTAPLTAAEIIRRTIQRKQENLARLGGFEGRLYSKLLLKLDGRGLSRLRISTNEEEPKRAIKERRRQAANRKPFDKTMQNFILESYSRVYRDEENDRTRVEILQRRQTANIPEDKNLLALTEFVNFYDNVIEIVSAEITSPIADDALSYYRYRIRERRKLGDKTVYVIDVMPDTELYPTFKGSLQIIEESYNLIEADLSPTEDAAIPFVEDLRYVQKFEEYNDSLWLPTFLQTTGNSHIEIISGALELDVFIKATSIYEEMDINADLPDSVFDKPAVVVSELADSTSEEYWENNSLSVLTDEEQQIYQEIDSLVNEDEDNLLLDGPDLSFNSPVIPQIDFNRVESVSLGVASLFLPGTLEFATSVEYSFGLEETFGSAGVATYLIDTSSGFLRIGARMFSEVSSFPDSDRYPEFLNAVSALVLHSDFYDYYRRDGWEAFIEGGIGSVELGLRFEDARHFSLPDVIEHSPIVADDLNFSYRPNLLISDGNYRSIAGRLQIGDPDKAEPEFRSDLALRLSGLYGERADGKSFRRVDGRLSASIPTLYTGYAPMHLRLTAGGGIAEDEMPVQFQFVMPRRFGLVGTFGHFFSVPTANFGGTQYLSIYAEHNFSDLLWRMIGLPEFDGRGVELIVQGGSAYFRNTSAGALQSTGSAWYSEAGFGLGKIPSLFSNFIFFRLDFVWGIGPVAGDEFGFGLTLSSPF